MLCNHIKCANKEDQYLAESIMSNRLDLTSTSLFESGSHLCRIRIYQSLTRLTLANKRTIMFPTLCCSNPVLCLVICWLWPTHQPSSVPVVLEAITFQLIAKFDKHYKGTNKEYKWLLDDDKVKSFLCPIDAPLHYLILVLCNRLCRCVKADYRKCEPLISSSGTAFGQRMFNHLHQ